MLENAPKATPVMAVVGLELTAFYFDAKRIWSRSPMHLYYTEVAIHIMTKFNQDASDDDVFVAGRSRKRRLEKDTRLEGGRCGLASIVDLFRQIRSTRCPRHMYTWTSPDFIIDEPFRVHLHTHTPLISIHLGGDHCAFWKKNSCIPWIRSYL